jgi:hypothetical protein
MAWVPVSALVSVPEPVWGLAPVRAVASEPASVSAWEPASVPVLASGRR